LLSDGEHHFIYLWPKKVYSPYPSIYYNEGGGFVCHLIYFTWVISHIGQWMLRDILWTCPLSRSLFCIYHLILNCLYWWIFHCIFLWMYDFIYFNEKLDLNANIFPPWTIQRSILSPVYTAKYRRWLRWFKSSTFKGYTLSTI